MIKTTLFLILFAVISINLYGDYTDDLCTSGTVTVTHTHSGDPTQLFDDVTGSLQWYGQWFNPFYITYDFGDGNSYSICKYTITGYSGYYPRTWTFEGSNDNINFTGLDTRTNDSSSANGTTASYTFVNSTSYRYYRFNITSCASLNYLIINELEMMEIAAPMSFESSTTETASTATIYQGTTENPIVRLKVVTTGNVSAFDATSITFNTNGTDNTSDITNAKVFYTTGTTFSNSTQFGSTNGAPSGSITFTGTQTLFGGDNYFWLTYDIATNATEDNAVDGQCTTVIVDGTLRTPTVTNPTGSRSISSGVYVNSSSGNDATGDGSSSAPFKTFHKGYTETPSGVVLDLTGTFDWTDADETGDAATSGYTIEKDLTIQGQGAGVTYIQADDTPYTADRCVLKIASGKTVTIQNLTIRYGYLVNGTNSGGIYSDGANTTILNCEITENANGDRWGECAITAKGGSFIMRNSTIHTNNGLTAKAATGTFYAGYAGSLFLQNTLSTAEITNCTFYDNAADYYGAIYNVNGGSTYITNSTFANNRGWSGADLYTYSGTTYIKNCIFSNSVSGTNVVRSSGTLTSNGYNVIETYSGFTADGDDITGDQTNLWGTGVSATPSLADNNTLNGTQTLKTLSGSVAIDAGNSSANGSVSIPSQDQRGAERNGAVDIGAYEWWSNDAALPVNLSSFTGNLENGFPTLNWITESELENLGWNIYRSEDENGIANNNTLKLNEELIPGMGTVTTPTEYNYIDEQPIQQAGVHYYWLESVSYSGELEIFGPVAINLSESNLLPEAPNKSFVNQNHPNPFNPTTTIEFGIEEGETGTLTIYNSKGQKVVSQKFDEGYHTFTWNASKQASGVYFYRLQTPSYHKENKMLLLK